jgi:regulator of protease activity HflC (stomatin/prohibitin superfamily)
MFALSSPLLLLIPCTLAIVLFCLQFILVQQAEVVIVERLGKFKKVLTPGLHFLIPFIDQKRYVNWTFTYLDYNRNNYVSYIKRSYRIDLREAVFDFPKQNVITKDNVMMEINALLYYQLTDVHAAMYEVANLPEAVEKLTQTTLRNVIGSLDLDESLVSRDAINTKLRLILDDATHKWGVKINRVELQEVNPPKDIRIAMEKQMRAERDRRAIILEAEGAKGAAILQAEGVKEAEILKAQGQAQAQVIAAQAEAESRLKIAKSEAQALEMLTTVLPAHADPTQYMIALKYMHVLPEMTKGHDNKLIIVPYEATSLASAVSSIKAMFEQKK